ncbi:hypothetical protein FHR24_002032 [Wenyingzhuangia heitensis]|uniref:Copper-binding protein MbnP-like domain-containing protein n=1 Tax=Wenyingzhuangia heitensis TaxID=1487859 RepID=A0ABX0UB28_9FLAO|nr:MbnP family protein [Wenyingzhuangia heitensis]NIJ45564.1 hypothetical protein [Wenyingzhuangia heitensis]
MKNFNKGLAIIFAAVLTLTSCTEDEAEAIPTVPTTNNVTLEFNNTFGEDAIVLGDATSAEATVNTSTEGQIHHFSELKYVISNIRLINEEDIEIHYNINDLDNGATVVNQAKEETLQYVLNNIPSATYTKIQFGLGVKSNLNTLDQEAFPIFYAAAGKNDTEMHWEWGTGYRFTKIEGFYGEDNTELSIHTGSTDDGGQGVDAYRDITLELPTNLVVGINAPKIVIKADFNTLLSGATTITLGEDNATPSIHTSVNMMQFVDNLGGNGDDNITGMFSVTSVEN